MSHATVTIEIPPKERFDLALPLNIPNEQLTPAVVQALNLPEKERENHLLAVKTEDGIVRLSPEVTLGDAGVLDGFILQFWRRDAKTPVRTEAGAKTFLQSDSGESFQLTGRSVSLGRRDVKRGVLVDIDLAPQDTGKVVSRRHASIEKEGEAYFITDLASTNGTKVNGKKLVPKERHLLENGDMIEFGRDGVRMRFVQNI